MEINKDILVNWFIKNEKKIYLDMFNCSHAIDNREPMKYHMEGTVWTHTLMVVTYIETFFEFNKNFESFNEIYLSVLTAGLLHDIGKPYTKEKLKATETKPERYMFKGHEGLSTFLVIGVLKKLKQDFPNLYTDDIIDNIIQIISLHGVSVESTKKDLLLMRNIFRNADKKGAIRDSNENIMSQYPDRKYLKRKTLDDDKKLIMFVGTPNSGKSTLREKFPEHTIISRDDYLSIFYTEEFGEHSLKYNEVYKKIHSDDKLKKKFDNVFNTYCSKISKNSNKVIIDLTMLSLSSRRKMLSKFPKFRASAYVILTDINSLIKREKERRKIGKKIHTKVYKTFFKNFTIPTNEEGFDEIKIIIN